jgi:CRISPR/Cas system-associated endonuclease Cas3-HD
VNEEAIPALGCRARENNNNNNYYYYYSTAYKLIRSLIPLYYEKLHAYFRKLIYAHSAGKCGRNGSRFVGKGI